MENRNDSQLSIEQRKQLLVARGAMYRSGILMSKEQVKSGLQADSLVRSAIRQIGLAAFAAWRGGSGLASVQTLAPMLVGGIVSLWRQPVWKPLVRGAMIAGAVASVTAFFFKRKKKPPPDAA
ncbi:MAG: hypothetical protein ACHP7O_09340 [Burkholderiales bacterium]